MRGTCILAFAIQKLVSCGIADGHCEHEERAGNYRGARDRNIEVPASRSDDETNNHPNHEFHESSSLGFQEAGYPFIRCAALVFPGYLSPRPLCLVDRTK